MLQTVCIITLGRVAFLRDCMACHIRNLICAPQDPHRIPRKNMLRSYRSMGILICTLRDCFACLQVSRFAHKISKVFCIRNSTAHLESECHVKLAMLHVFWTYVKCASGHRTHTLSSLLFSGPSVSRVARDNYEESSTARAHNLLLFFGLLCRLEYLIMSLSDPNVLVPLGEAVSFEASPPWCGLMMAWEAHMLCVFHRGAFTDTGMCKVRFGAIHWISWALERGLSVAHCLRCGLPWVILK